MAIRYDKDGTVVTITINRPEAMNAMDRDTSRELAQAFQDFDHDEDLLVAILTGAGDKAFSAGADLKKMYALAEDDPPVGSHGAPPHRRPYRRAGGLPAGDHQPRGAPDGADAHGATVGR